MAFRDGCLEPVKDAIESSPASSHLIDLNLRLSGWLSREFGVSTPSVRSSELDVSGHKSELIRNICLAAGAEEYIAGPSGRDYLDLSDFAEHGIRVLFFDFDHPEYDQGVPFVSHLSAVDAWARLPHSDLPSLLTSWELNSS